MCRRTYSFGLFLVAALPLALALLPSKANPATSSNSSHFENILGTSLDLLIVASDDRQAKICEEAVLEEIERLRSLLSTYDPTTELSQLNRSTAPVRCSPETIEVLRSYEVWQRYTGGALNGRLGELLSLWKMAEKGDRPPSDAELAPVVSRLSQSAWVIDEQAGTVTKQGEGTLNVNSVGRGYVLEKAALHAWKKTPGLTGLLVNLGGDMRMLGDPLAGAGWRVDIADPGQPQENAPALTTVSLPGGSAIATSASYERYYKIGGLRYSHIVDPRTGHTVEGMASTTVVALNSPTANALATSLMVLTPQEGMDLVAKTPGAQCLLVDATGRQYRSAGFKALEIAQATPDDKGAPKADDASEAAKDKAATWPKGNEALINLSITSGGRRPYIAVWIEDAKSKPVRTIAVWGNDGKWIKELSYWLKATNNDKAILRTVSRATRNPGQYAVVWDGKDDKGRWVDLGDYTVRVEINREHGQHIQQRTVLHVGPDPAALTMTRTAECGETKIKYGPHEK